MPSKWIDWNNAYNDPVKSLFETGKSGLQKYIKEKKEEIYQNEKHLDDKWKALHNQVLDLQEHIKLEKKKNKIGWRKFANGLIIFLAILTLSIAFWIFYVPFKNNKETINKFNEFKQKTEKEIDELNNQKFNLLFEMLDKYQIGNLFEQTLNSFDINWYRNDIYLPYVVKQYVINLPKSTIRTNYETFNIKNRDITVFNHEELEIRPVTTSATTSWSVSYQDSNGEWKSRMVSYTGYHTEPTPFMEWNSPVAIAQSNFDFDFQLKESKIKPKIKFENEAFNKLFNVEHNNIDTMNSEVKLRQVFSLLAQENYVKMAKDFDVNLIKYGHSLISFTKNNLESTIYRDLSLMQYYDFDPNTDLHKILNAFFNNLSQEIINILSFMTIIYGSPSFAQEDVSQNNFHYKVRNYHDLDDKKQYQLDYNEFDDLPFIALNKYDSARKLEGVTHRIMDRVIYNPYGLFKQISEDTYVFEYSRIWYTTEKKYDAVMVGSGEDGYRTVMVPYIRYYEHGDKLYAILKGVKYNGDNFEFNAKFNSDQIQQYLKIAKQNSLVYTINSNSVFMIFDDDIDSVVDIAYNL